MGGREACLSLEGPLPPWREARYEGRDGRPPSSTHTHTLLKGKEKRVELPLSFRAKLRNPRVRQKKIRMRG
jgi:hypothetical protein